MSIFPHGWDKTKSPAESEHVDRLAAYHTAVGHIEAAHRRIQQEALHYQVNPNMITAQAPFPTLTGANFDAAKSADKNVVMRLEWVENGFLFTYHGKRYVCDSIDEVADRMKACVVEERIA